MIEWFVIILMLLHPAYYGHHIPANFNPQPGVVYTFDDGYEDFYTKAYPLIVKNKAYGMVAVITSRNDDKHINAEQIREMDRAGIIIASHTETHRNLTKLSDKEIEWELKTSKEKLEKIVGHKIDIIVYPYGAYNDKVISIAKKVGYKYGITTHPYTKGLFEIGRIPLEQEVKNDSTRCYQLCEKYYYLTR